jgi:tetratricopeptide (TPR) repeat protein
MEAVRLGQRARAKDLLTRLLRADQSNPLYWLWMSSVVDTSKEQTYCLQTVLRLEPGNRAARQGLVLIGAAQPDENVVPRPPVRRKWQVEEIEQPPTGIKGYLKKPVVRIAVFILIGVVLLGLIAGGIFGYDRKPAAVALRPTNTYGPAPAYTLTPTPEGGIPTPKITPSPTYQGPKPLWMSLEATYTPTPLYVNTPHPISEAFRAGQRALERGDTVTALMFLKQASQVDPSAPDIPYYIGEVYRASAEYQAAIDAYNQSHEVNPAFAPSYLGQARAILAINPNADISQDLQAAIGHDPNLGEAYLELAAFHLARNDLNTALPALESAEVLMPDSPLVLVYKAQMELLNGNFSDALALASEANKRDLTLLPAYLVIGQASLASGEHQQAVNALETYLDYETDNPVGWLALAQAYAGFNQSEQAYAQSLPPLEDQTYESALAAFDAAIEINEDNPELYLYRGLLYLAQGEGQSAVNDFVSARKLDSKSFPVNLALGRALLTAGRPREAYAQIDGSLARASSDSQLAMVYFWRAMAAEEDGLDSSAVEDWQALLALPAEALLPGWSEIAEEHLMLLSGTPTALASATMPPRQHPARRQTYGAHLSPEWWFRLARGKLRPWSHHGSTLLRLQ